MKKNDALLKLKADIKSGSVKGIYIFTGEEVYLKEKYIRDITELIHDGGFPDFNHIKLEGNSVDTEEYDNAWESFPMMSDRKLLLIKNSGIFVLRDSDGIKAPNEDKKEFWLSKLKRVPEDTVIIFDEKKADKRSSIYKAALKCGTAVEFNFLSESDRAMWVVREVRASGKKISRDCSVYLVNMCDPGLMDIKNELDKLISFCKDEIYKSDIDRVVSKPMQMVIFDLTDAIMHRDAKTAVGMLKSMKTGKESAFGILYLLFSSFDKMLHIKLLSGQNSSDIAKQTGIAPFMVRKYQESVKEFSEDKLVYMVKRVGEIDMEIKEGRTDEWTALEMYVAEGLHNDCK